MKTRPPGGPAERAHEMQTAKPIPGGSGPRHTSAAFRKAARWLRNRLQATEARHQSQESGQRAGIGEDALRVIRERYHIEES